MKKQVIFFAAVFSLCLMNKAFSQVVASGTTGDCTWELTGTTGNYTLTISGSGAMGDYGDGGSPWFSYNSDIKTLDIQQGVTSIGDYAFSVCYGLTSVTIPNSVTSIGEQAFSGCHSLISLTVEEDNPNYCSVGGVLFDKSQDTLIQYPGGKQGSYAIPNSVTTIGDWAFTYCIGLTSATIGNSVTEIGDWAFYGCHGLTGTLTIPNSVITIGYYAFSGCSGLMNITVEASNPNYCSVDGVLFNKSQDALIQYPGGKQGSYAIPNSVTTIGEAAFAWCTGLTSATIGNSVTTIGVAAFYYCIGLTSVTIGNSVTTIGDEAFASCRALTSVTIPHSVITIGHYAFDMCTGLTSVTIGDSVTTIGSWAFFNCTGLTSITIPNAVTTIGLGAFSDCSGLTSVIIGSSVTTIGDMVFWGCSGLTSITIPNSVITIGEVAFRDCSGLTEIHVKATTPPRIEASTFYNVPTNIPVYVCGEVEDYRNAEHWGNFTNFLPDNNCDDVAVEELAADIINIYPNPATDNIIISLREMITNAVFTLYDMQGKVLMRQQVSNEDVISVNEFAAGIYIYNVSTGKGNLNGKITIVNN
jgi:hypothetical protein